MSHTAGMYDHPESENFVNGILENPQKEWTMQGQIKAGVDWGDPVGAPGEKFSYSDTGYVLLGNIIERASGVSLPVAVRTLLQLDKIAPGAIVWERGDSAPVPEERRVHQYFQGMDIFDWSPTIDLYGGGGLLASPKGMAEFFTALFSGEVFTKPETLEVMLSKEGLPEGSPYRLGVFDHKYDELHVYEHGGFWGTNVMYHPKSGTVIAGAVLKQSDYRQMISIMTGYLRNLE
jgi:D-alanyl-D-alanine carboxypeptidase